MSSKSINPISGVYKILCIPTGKIYVGASADIVSRCERHRSALRSKCHDNMHLQSAWDEYGADAFVVSVIEVVKKKDLTKREEYWIDELKSRNRDYGYNINRSGGDSAQVWIDPSNEHEFPLNNPRAPRRSKLDQYRPEIEALLSNGSTQKFVARRYGTTEANLSRWMKRHKIERPLLSA